jgi:hypothetical protein
MIKKLLLMAALGVMLALTVVLAGGTPAKANPGGLQNFDLDIADCLVASYPPAIPPSPDPGTGPYQVCANSPAEDKGLGPRSAATPGYAMTTAIGLDGGNRVGLPYVYSGPGWGLKSDAEITDTTPVADIIAISDLFANGIGDVLADPSNCSGGSCNPLSPLDFTNATPLPYLEQTTAWSTTSGCPGTGGDESSLTLVTPGSSAMSRYVRWRACIGTEFLNSYFRYNLPVPAPLNLVFFHPNWSPAGTHVNLVSLATSVDAPTTSLTTLDTPQGSLTAVRAPYADNPVAPGLYVRWSTELSNPDGRNAAVNFMYSTNCKAIGGSFTDADADCLASVDGAHPAPLGQPVDPNDNNPDIDGDGLLDGVEVAWGSGPPFINLGITVVSDPPASCSDTGPWTLSGTGLDQVDIIDGKVDVNELGGVTADDDLADMPLHAVPGGVRVVDIIDGQVDVDQSGAVDAADDLADVQLFVAGWAVVEVDIINGQVDVDGGGVGTTDDLDDVQLARIQPGQILDVGNGEGLWESVKVEEVTDATHITVQRCVDRTEEADIAPGWYVWKNPGIQVKNKPVLWTVSDPVDTDDEFVCLTPGNAGLLLTGDLLNLEMDSSRETVKVEEDPPYVAGPCTGGDVEVTVQRAVLACGGRASPQGWPINTRVYRCITDRFLTDMDADGRTDLEEMVGPTQYLTDPTNADTDGDTVLDGGLKLDLHSVDDHDPADGCQESGPPDGKPDFPDQNGDGICDPAPVPPELGWGMSANLDLTSPADGSSHVRVGYKIVGRDIKPDNVSAGGNDNCGSIANAGQLNSDLDTATTLGNGDYYGDACDTDWDNDGMTNVAEANFKWNPSTKGCSSVPPMTGSPDTLLPLDPDTDGDGILDGVECNMGSNPKSAPDVPPACTAAAGGLGQVRPDVDGDLLCEGSDFGKNLGLPIDNEESFWRTEGFSGYPALDAPAGDSNADSDLDGLTDGCEVMLAGTQPMNPDTDGDIIAVNDKSEAVGASALAPGHVACGDPVAPKIEYTAIGNGISVNSPSADDVTVPNSKGGRTADTDKDGLLNYQDTNPAGGLLANMDYTYDDDGDGMSCIPTGGADPTDTGPSWDANCNAKLDGPEAAGMCPLAVNPTGDDDGDGLLNTWEVCKWGTDPKIVDSDGDGKGDCIEACDTDGNGLCGFGDDALNSARATLLPAGTGTGKFGKDGDFDLNGNNLLSGDFGNDTIRTAQYAFKILACK